MIAAARSGGEERRARFPFGSVAPPGRYDVWVRYTSTKSGSWGVPVDIEHAEGRATRFLDQRIAGGTWVYVGTYPMTRDSGATIRTNGVAGGVVADAIEFCQSTYDEQPRVGSDGLGAGAPCGPQQASPSTNKPSRPSSAGSPALPCSGLSPCAQ